MQGFFNIKEIGSISGTEDFDITGSIEGGVGPQKVSGEMGFFWIKFDIKLVVIEDGPTAKNGPRINIFMWNRYSFHDKLRKIK